VRIALLCAGLAATLLFAPWVLFGASVGLDAYLQGDAPDAAAHRWMLWVGLGGLFGLIGVWIRLFYRADQLAAAPRLRNFTAASLGLGVVTALALVAHVGMNVADPQLWLYTAAAVVSGVLFAATLAGAGRGD
jgi:hypothetical protein